MIDIERYLHTIFTFEIHYLLILTCCQVFSSACHDLPATGLGFAPLSTARSAGEDEKKDEDGDEDVIL